MKPLALALGMLIWAGCIFKVNGAGPTEVSDLSTPTGDDMMLPDVDMAMGGNDVAMSTCTPAAVTCMSGSVLTCRNDGSGYDVSATCPLGCNDTPSPHCNVVYPTQPIARGDFSGPLSDVTVSIADTTFDTTTGRIDANAGTTVIRGANLDPTVREIGGMATPNSGIAFRTVAITGGGGARVGIWSFNKLTVNASINVVMAGNNAAAWVAVTDINMYGTVDDTCFGNVQASMSPGPATFYVPGPGGFRGATSAIAKGEPAAAGGGTTSSAGASGGGGGGFGADGSAGGKEQTNNGGVAGGTFGVASLNPLRGGSGGGAGGNTGGVGGGGGGAMVLVAQGTITIGNGSVVSGINASGCGGRAGGNNTGGGGGGAGGAVLLEAPTIHLAAMGGAIANGGGGGGGDNTNAVPAGGAGGQGSLAMATTAAAGGMGGTQGGTGGTGGVAANTTGGTAGMGDQGGGGGGGGVGRIRLNSRTMSATLDVGYLLSPRLLDAGMVATQGQLDVH